MMTAHEKRRGTGLKSMLALSAIAILGAGSLTGCQSDAQTGMVLGAGAGALAGQAIGRDTEGTLIGTAIGAGAGYVIGNESDKAKNQNDRSDDW